MKGLLIKDLRLMKMQKNFFILIIVIGIGLVLAGNEISFTLVFLSFVISLFSISTISYDEFDNGYPFLFTLPISRSLYVKEKYVLSLILGLGSLILATVICAIITLFKNNIPLFDLLMMALMILPYIILVQAIMIPFQLKFGAERGRIAIIGVLGAIILLGILIFQGLKILKINFASMVEQIYTLDIKILGFILIILAVMILFISLIISIKIMKQKEF